MEAHGINFLAVAIAAVAYMILGALWYSPVLFGKAWLAGIGRTKEQATQDFSPVNYLWAFISAFLASYGMARLMLWTGRSSVSEGITIGLVVGLCFVFASFWVNDSFEKRPFPLTLINVLYHLSGLILAGVIIALWR